MHSMTGFGAGTSVLGAGRISIEAKSVNHRHLDLRVHFEDGLDERHAIAVEALVRARFDRGRFDIRGRWDTDPRGEASLDEARARAAWKALRKLRDELAPGEPVPLSLLASLPGLFRNASEHDRDAVHGAVTEATHDALDRLATMRAREGASLKRELLRLLQTVEEHTRALEVRAPALAPARRARLLERIEALLHERIELDRGRIEHEVALFADRCDVTEELARLDSHGAQFRRFIEQPASVGRKLDFLLQEMNREANTMAAKLLDAEATQRVVALKGDIERLRQQVANVE